MCICFDLQQAILQEPVRESKEFLEPLEGILRVIHNFLSAQSQLADQLPFRVEKKPTLVPLLPSLRSASLLTEASTSKDTANSNDDSNDIVSLSPSSRSVEPLPEASPSSGPASPLPEASPASPLTGSAPPPDASLASPLPEASPASPLTGSAPPPDASLASPLLSGPAAPLLEASVRAPRSPLVSTAPLLEALSAILLPPPLELAAPLPLATAAPLLEAPLTLLQQPPSDSAAPQKPPRQAAKSRSISRLTGFKLRDESPTLNLLEENHKKWSNAPTTFFSVNQTSISSRGWNGQLQVIARCLELQQTSAHGEILRRFYCYVLQGMQEGYKITPDARNLAKAIYTEYTSLGLETLIRTIKALMQAGAAYKAIAEKLGTGAIFLLGQETPRHIWERLPRSGPVYVKAMDILIEAGVKKEGEKYQDLADRLIMCIKTSVQSHTWDVRLPRKRSYDELDSQNYQKRSTYYHRHTTQPPESMPEMTDYGGVIGPSTVKPQQNHFTAQLQCVTDFDMGPPPNYFADRPTDVPDLGTGPPTMQPQYVTDLDLEPPRNYFADRPADVLDLGTALPQDPFTTQPQYDANFDMEPPYNYFADRPTDVPDLGTGPPTMQPQYVTDLDLEPPRNYFADRPADVLDLGTAPPQDPFTTQPQYDANFDMEPPHDYFADRPTDVPDLGTSPPTMQPQYVTDLDMEPPSDYFANRPTDVVDSGKAPHATDIEKWDLFSGYTFTNDTDLITDELLL